MTTEKQIWEEMKAVGLPSAEDLDRFLEQQRDLDRAREMTNAVDKTTSKISGE